MAKTTIKEIVDLLYETQMGNMHKCMEKQHELADLMWSLHEEFYGEDNEWLLHKLPGIHHGIRRLLDIYTQCGVCWKLETLQ